ncbi:hypothetical protein KXV85_004756, partial [Aspergillus fumigatus]
HGRFELQRHHARRTRQGPDADLRDAADDVAARRRHARNRARLLGHCRHRRRAQPRRMARQAGILHLVGLHIAAQFLAWYRPGIAAVGEARLAAGHRLQRLCLYDPSGDRSCRRDVAGADPDAGRRRVVADDGALRLGRARARSRQDPDHRQPRAAKRFGAAAQPPGHSVLEPARG